RKERPTCRLSRAASRKWRQRGHRRSPRHPPRWEPYSDWKACRSFAIPIEKVLPAYSRQRVKMEVTTRSLPATSRWFVRSTGGLQEFDQPPLRIGGKVA